MWELSFGGLIQEENLGVRDKSATKIDTLAHAGGERIHFLVGLVAQVDDGQQFVDAPVGFAGWHAVELCEHPELLAHGQDAVARLLTATDHRDAPAHRQHVTRDIHAVDIGFATAGSEQCRQNLDQCGLACSIASKQAKQFAPFDSQTDAVQCCDRLTRLARAVVIDAAQVYGLDGGNFICLCCLHGE